MDQTCFHLSQQRDFALWGFDKYASNKMDLNAEVWLKYQTEMQCRNKEIILLKRHSDVTFTIASQSMLAAQGNMP